ncbi:MAG: nicotinate (nicotinamide) nucleotide adenylyltransferase [Gemmatimonadetes bacterium]|nr:nicotinate (nicotinamide) nucleotide adenylyltransferase [Gemmatimonadota bacterium]
MAPAPDVASPLRIGIFGGTFDPPHVGHVRVVRDVADALALDRVLWMPARVSPHKLRRPLSPAAVRLEMVRAAVAGEPRFEVSEMELERPGPSYTVDTLRELRARWPSAGLFLILGADQLRVFASWRGPREILEMATLALMDREGEATTAVAPDLPGMERAVHVPVTRVDVSGTRVRAAVAAGEDVSGTVPEGVRAVIERERLYRG